MRIRQEWYHKKSVLLARRFDHVNTARMALRVAYLRRVEFGQSRDIPDKPVPGRQAVHPVVRDHVPRPGVVAYVVL